MKIGNVNIDNNLILGPMAGVTDLPFRMLCKEQGCGLLYSEMVSAKAILYKNKNTKQLLEIDKGEHPIAVQLFGSDASVMAEMTKVVAEGTCDIIDVNMGCPVPKVVNNGEGSALMKNPGLVENILDKMVRATDKPITVKIRKGFDDNSINAVEIAKIAESVGVAAVAVHGRTRQQYYSGKADWDIIKAVKGNVSIPVIGNGDIFTAQDAFDMLEYTGCDGIMVGRGARGNPWIFHQIDTYLKTGTVEGNPGVREIVDMILRHAAMMIEYKGEFTGMHEMRKHVAWYTSGLPNSSKLRSMVNSVETYEELKNLLETMLGNA